MAALGKTTGYNQRKAHTALATLFDNARHRHGRRTDNREIDPTRDVMQGFKRLLTLHYLVLRINREQPPPEAGL